MENLHAMSLSTSIETNLHECVVLVEIRLVQNVGFKVVVDQRLPSSRQTEDIEAIDTGKVLHLCLSHVCARAAILLFEFIGSEVALVRLVSSNGPNGNWRTCIAYGSVDSDLTTCDVDTSKPDGAGLSCESGDEERADSHVDGSQRGAVLSTCLQMLRRGSRSEQQQRGDDD